VFHGAIEHHFSIFDTCRLWGKGRLCRTLIADIFEALTAPDRHYKSGKSLRQTLQIMTGMCDSGYIDLVLFALFLEMSIPERYAAIHLSLEQRDAIDPVSPQLMQQRTA